MGPGDHVAGFRLGHKIDEGGLGAIYAIDADDDVPRVIKLMHASRMPEGRAVHESKLGAAVGGNRFPKVYASGSEGAFHYLVMERIEGWNVAAIAGHARRADVRFSVASVTALAAEALLALHGLHEALDPETGIWMQAVHRDVKLSNVMLRPDGHTCLIDLGVGKSNVQTWRTRTGALVGTLGYISPEQAMGEPIDRRADIYAVGVMLYALLTFQPYVEPGTPAEMVRRMNQQVFVPPSKHRPDVPPELDVIVRRALERRPEDRFADATAMHDALAKDWPGEGETLLGYAETHLALDDAAPTQVVVSPRVFRPTESLFEAKPAPFVWPVVGASLLAGSVAFFTYTALVPGEAPSGEAATGAAPSVRAPTVAPRAPVTAERRDAVRVGDPSAPTDADEPGARDPPASHPSPPDDRVDSKPQRKVASRRPSKPRDVPVAAPPPAASVSSLVDALTARAEALRARAPRHTTAIDDIVADAALWRRAKDEARARAALARLDRRLAALER